MSNDDDSNISTGDMEVLTDANTQNFAMFRH